MARIESHWVPGVPSVSPLLIVMNLDTATVMIGNGVDAKGRPSGQIPVQTVADNRCPHLTSDPNLMEVLA